MFIIGKIIFFIIALFSGLLSSSFYTSTRYEEKIEVEGIGGSIGIRPLDPKDFISSLDAKTAYIMESGNPKLITPENFPQIDATKPLIFKIHNRLQSWQPYKNIFSAPPEGLKGETVFLMTPWLRQWQLSYIPPLVDFAAINIFDIGIGTGRSLKLWKELGAEEVNGVEPNLDNIANLQKKNIGMLGKVLPVGGEDFERISKEFPKGKTDFVLMSYSLTFFIKKNMDNLVKTINYLTHSGSFFCGIGMDGNKIKEYLGSSEKLDNSVFSLEMKDPKEDLINLTIKNKFTLVKSQDEYLVDIPKFLKPFLTSSSIAGSGGWKQIYFKQLEAPYYLTGWAKKFVEAQVCFILQKS